MSKIFPAATVVLVRDGESGLEVLMLRRSTAVSFARGSWVFPGGRIDKEDYSLDLDDIESAARRGAARETQEEANLTINEQSMVYFAHWTTPPSSPKRFATWFFISDVTGAGHHDVIVDGSEIVEHRWYTPQQALADRQAKLIDMMPPTFMTLEELLDCQSAAEAVSMAGNVSASEKLPQFSKSGAGIAMAHADHQPTNEGVSGAGDNISLIDEAWRGELLS
ncbi:MAG: NUDIX hydrolase [Oceanicoccus sp.]